MPPVFFVVDDNEDVDDPVVAVVAGAAAAAGLSVELELIVVCVRGASPSPNKTIVVDIAHHSTSIKTESLSTQGGTLP